MKTEYDCLLPYVARQLSLRFRQRRVRLVCTSVQTVGRRRDNLAIFEAEENPGAGM